MTVRNPTEITELEQRLAALEQHTLQPQKITAKRHSRLYTTIGALVIISLIAGVLSLTFINARNQDPLRALASRVDYPIYVVANDQTAYTYAVQSEKVEANVVFATAKSGSKSINISQQKLPDAPPDLSHLNGFKKFDVAAGEAVIGVNGNLPTAIVLSNTTLITLNASSNVPTDELRRFVQALQSIQR